MAQGCGVTDNILAQDNRSPAPLERSGKASSSKRAKHASVRHFFVTDRVAKGELEIEWCPTLEMIGDYVTKPLRGALLREFRDLIVGAAPVERKSHAKETIKKAATEPATPRKKEKKKMASPTKSKRRHRSVLDLKGDHGNTCART